MYLKWSRWNERQAFQCGDGTVTFLKTNQVKINFVHRALLGRRTTRGRGSRQNAILRYLIEDAQHLVVVATVGVFNVQAIVVATALHGRLRRTRGREGRGRGRGSGSGSVEVDVGVVGVGRAHVQPPRLRCVLQLPPVRAAIDAFGTNGSTASHACARHSGLDFLRV